MSYYIAEQGITMQGPANDVSRTFGLIVAHLGERFSFQELADFIAACRVKELRIEEVQLPVAVSGLCVALQDVDLICTRAGLDPVLSLATKLHECAHLLLRHVPQRSFGSETRTYREFLQQPDLWLALHRDHTSTYDAPHEHAAELLATLLFERMTCLDSAISELAMHVYGIAR